MNQSVVQRVVSLGCQQPTVNSVSSRDHVMIHLDDDMIWPNSVRPLRDFWWDKVILTMILLILGVTGAQTIGSYLKSPEVKCLIEENHTRNEEDYLNQLCTGGNPIYLHGRSIVYFTVALLSGIQILWTLICGGHIESFKSSVSSMCLQRNSQTGLFEANDLETARYLESQLHSKILTCTYITFKLSQFIVCIPSIMVPLFLFEVGADITFTCSSGTFHFQQWPLTVSEIFCTYEEIASLQLLQWVNMVALVVIMVATLCGALLLIYRFHSFDYKKIAAFLLRTGLRREHYKPYDHYSMASCKGLCFKLLRNNIQHQETASWDMMFLIIRQYETNHKIGEALLNCLINVHIDYLAECTCAQMQKATNHVHDHHHLEETTDDSTKHGCSHHHLEEAIEGIYIT